jgi:MFS family permease
MATDLPSRRAEHNPSSSKDNYNDDQEEEEPSHHAESVPLLASHDPTSEHTGASSSTATADTMFGRGKTAVADDSKTSPPVYDSPPASSDAQRNFSVAPEELTGLSLYEKKCVLINHEMDRNGMGRYQWYIWFLCGFGYLLDLLWAQAFSLVLSPLQQELGFPPNNSGNIFVSLNNAPLQNREERTVQLTRGPQVAFSAGLTAGAAFWGILVDIIGRKWAFNLTCLISAAFGLGLGGCNTYTAFLVVTAFVGFGIGGNVPIDTTICLEFLPQNRRFLLALLSIFQPIGVVITSAIAYGFIPNYSCKPNFSQKNALKSCNITPAGEPCCSRADNMGWRYLMFTIGALTLGVFLVRFVVFNFKESPKFLVFRERDAEAIEVLQHIAKVNKRICELRKEDLEALEQDEIINGGSATDRAAKILAGAAILAAGNEGAQPSIWASLNHELSRYKLLFDGRQMTRLTLLIWLTYICDFWGFTLAGT